MRLGGAYSPEERALLSRYVTDLDGDVYCIYNLPEEVIAVIFAYVSRSPLSFRTNLLKLLQSGDLDLMTLPGAGEAVPLDDGETKDGLDPAVARARKFHERYTVGYGHASVAEHAVVRIGVEKVSRFVSALLETANPFLSFTEYSQRYQRPERGAYYVPRELDADPAALERYIAFQERCFDVYERLFEGLHRHLLAVEPRQEGESDTARSRRLEKLAFEDARYALSLATHTNLGMTGNARAIRDAIVVLSSHEWPESRELAARMTTQVKRLVPTLLRYADPNPYRQAAFDVGRSLAGQLDRSRPADEGAWGPSGEGSLVRLLDWTGRTDGGDAGREGEPADGEDEARALDVVLAGAALGTVPGAMGAREAEALLAGWSLEEKRRWARSLLEGIGPHDNPPDATHRIRYSVEFLVSEANWHQLLRHCRRIDFIAELPHTSGGLVVPPRLVDAGLDGPLRRLAEEAADLSDYLEARFPRVMPYVVLNTHRRRASAELNLWELYHLVNLRTSPEAQWDIRETMVSLYEQVARIHPTLVSAAMRRAGRTEEMIFHESPDR